MRPYNPSDLLQPQKGFIYEPRALWSRAHREEFRGALVSESNFDRAHFYNAEKRPIIITDMVVMSRPLEYASTYYVSPDASGYGYGSPPMQNARIRVNRRGVRPFSMDFTPSSIAFRGTTQSGPLSRDRRVAPTTETQQRFNDGFNVARWAFDFPIGVTDRGSIQYDLSGCPIMVDGLPGGGLQQFQASGTTLFSEPADRPQITPGNVRANQYNMQPVSKRDLEMFSTVAAANAVEANAAGFEGIPPLAVFGNSVRSTWDNGFGFPSAKFIGAQVAADGPSYLSGVTHAFRKTGAQSPFTQNPLTPPALRNFGNLNETIYCRARTRNGGTGAWWWREGAPVAIVSPTQTSVPVYRFPRPFVLAPGEALEAVATIDQLYPDGSYDGNGYRSHGLWLSFCGYAAIEG